MVWQGLDIRTEKNALCGEGSPVCLKYNYTNMRFGKQAEKLVR